MNNLNKIGKLFKVKEDMFLFVDCKDCEFEFIKPINKISLYIDNLVMVVDFVECDNKDKIYADNFVKLLIGNKIGYIEDYLFNDNELFEEMK